MKKHKVELTCEERETLETITRKGEHSALKLMRAHILSGRLDGCTDR